MTRLLNDLFKGSDERWSLKNICAGLAFCSGILVCFFMVGCCALGKPVPSIEIPLSLFGTAGMYQGLTGWQQIMHRRIDAGVSDTPAINVDTSTKVEVS